MLAILTTTPSVSRNTLRVVNRNILVSWSHSKAEIGHEEYERLSKTILKKKYKDLPRSRRLIDGSSAPSLAAWPGGLECVESGQLEVN